MKTGAQDPAAKIFSAIEKKFGFVPPFFIMAKDSPAVLENLWAQTRSAYLESPLDALFLEKLFAYLSRFCNVPYCLVCHSCFLRPLGMKARDVLALLETPLPCQQEIQNYMRLASNYNSLAEEKWPASGSELEAVLIWLSVAVYLRLEKSGAALLTLRRLLGIQRYQHLVSFLGYVRTCGMWIEAHPELSYEADKRVMDHMAPSVQEEPRLVEFFANYQERVLNEIRRQTEEKARLQEAS